MVVGSKGITAASFLNASSFFSSETDALLLQGKGEVSCSSSQEVNFQGYMRVQFLNPRVFSF